MSSRKLKLNEGKTDIILIKGSKRCSIEQEFGELSFGSNVVPLSESICNIGVTFDTSLSFDKHINNISRDCNFYLRNLHRIKTFLNQDTLLTLIHAMITSRVDYCNSIFTGLPKKHLKKLQLILNRAARLIFSVSPRDRITPYLIKLHWLTIIPRSEYKICLIVYKVLKYKQPSYLLDLLKFYESPSMMTLRASDDPFRLVEPVLVGQLSFGMRSFAYTAPRLINQVPIAIKSLTSLDSFKAKLKSYFFVKSYDLDQNTVQIEYHVM